MSAIDEAARAIVWRQTRARRPAFVATLAARLAGSEVAKAQTVAGWQAVNDYTKEQNHHERQDPEQGHRQVVNS